MSRNLDSRSSRGDTKPSCSFCNETFSSSTSLREHLIVCGNKTDKCSACQRYIRRAIFSYHVENNCAELDDSFGSDSFKPNPSGNKQIDNKQTDYTQTTIPYIIRCEFCTEDCYQQHYDIHKDYCSDNPNNLENKKRLRDKAKSNRNRSPDNLYKKDTDVVRVRCQYCDNLIESSNLSNHQRTCNKPPTAPEEQNQSTTPKPTGPFQCLNCNKQFQEHQRHYIHQMNCRKKSGNNS